MRDCRRQAQPLSTLPVADLGLGQGYRFDTHGRPYLYFPAATASGLLVDGQAVAGVIISLGENQLQDYVVAGATYTTNGDDTLVPIEVNTEAVAIALAELETLGKRVEAYNRILPGCRMTRGYEFLWRCSAGAPPIIDPDYYDNTIPVRPVAPDIPNCTPLRHITWPIRATPILFNPVHWPTTFPPGPPPTFTQLVLQQEHHLLPLTGPVPGPMMETS